MARGWKTKGMTGYADWRYGSSKKSRVKMPSLLGEGKHQQLTQMTSAALRQWDLSPFQHEGACRHGLRSAMCLDGHAWEHADFEAATIVAKALSINGARRPTWAEGQPEHTAASDTCLCCQGPLDEESMTRQAKFCSRDCAAMYINRKGQTREMQAQPNLRAALQAVRTADREVKACECCGKSFQSRSWSDQSAADQRFCSRDCRAKSRRTIEERACECCGTMFRPSLTKSAGKFCSPDCYHKSERPAFELQCKFCGDGFSTNRVGGVAIYCSNRCMQAQKRIGKGVVPKALPVHVFDHYFTKPVNASRPPWLTPERFDELVAA